MVNLESNPKLESGSILTGVDVGDIKLRVNQIQIEYPYFVEDTLRELITELIVKPIQRKMEADGISKKIIDSTKLGSKPHKHKKASVIWTVVSDYRSISGFPVAVMIEHGRKAFFVEPKDPTYSRPNPTLKFDIGDETVFSKGHHIPEYRARKYVHQTVRENKKDVKRELNRRTKGFVRAIMGNEFVVAP